MVRRTSALEFFPFIGADSACPWVPDRHQFAQWLPVDIDLVEKATVLKCVVVLGQGAVENGLCSLREREVRVPGD